MNLAEVLQRQETYDELQEERVTKECSIYMNTKTGMNLGIYKECSIYMNSRACINHFLTV